MMYYKIIDLFKLYNFHINFIFIYKSYEFITILCRKRKNGYPNSGYPYPTPISGYLPGSVRSVSDPNPKLYYPGITRIRPEYKNICIRIRKMVPNQYPYPVPVSGTLPVFTPITIILSVWVMFPLVFTFMLFKLISIYVISILFYDIVTYLNFNI